MSRTDIDALNATFMKGMETGDAAMIASVYAPDARVMPRARRRSPSDRAVLAGGPRDGHHRRRAQDDLVESDDVAVEEGHEMMGSAVVDTGKYVVVHRRQPDGEWRLGVDIWNSDSTTQPG